MKEFCWSCRGVTENGGMYHAVDCDNDNQCKPIIPEDKEDDMYSNDKLDLIAQAAKDYVETARVYAIKNICTNEDCNSRLCRLGEYARDNGSVKFTRLSRLRLKKVLTTFYNGVHVDNTVYPRKVTGHTKQYKFSFNHNSLVTRYSDGDEYEICEGEGEEDSFGVYLVKHCRNVEDFYATLSQFVNKWDY